MKFWLVIVVTLVVVVFAGWFVARRNRKTSADMEKNILTSTTRCMNVNPSETIAVIIELEDDYIAHVRNKLLPQVFIHAYCSSRIRCYIIGGTDAIREQLHGAHRIATTVLPDADLSDCLERFANGEQYTMLVSGRAVLAPNYDRTLCASFDVNSDIKSSIVTSAGSSHSKKYSDSVYINRKDEAVGRKLFRSLSVPCTVIHPNLVFARYRTIVNLKHPRQAFESKYAFTAAAGAVYVQHSRVYILANASLHAHMGTRGVPSDIHVVALYGSVSSYKLVMLNVDKRIARMKPEKERDNIRSIKDKMENNNIEILGYKEDVSNIGDFQTDMGENEGDDNNIIVEEGQSEESYNEEQKIVRKVQHIDEKKMYLPRQRIHVRRRIK